MDEKEKISFELEKFIERKIHELRLEPKPTLDQIICAFLEKFEVYVKLTTKTRNIAGSAAAGAITGMYGAMLVEMLFNTRTKKTNCHTRMD